ncbi:hypothetical protein B0T22DRAFT_448166 [Podospora appendiculata]|uniref:C2H2-type domain-containing protein n=1 Tax=Podospora appendiculata TaxID=314037 RepID=A0AAE1CFN5_9PEZI|nr:hypothetical protein B0T22DRAFT_448166 [Podospora appendiculata]
MKRKAAAEGLASPAKRQLTLTEWATATAAVKPEPEPKLEHPIEAAVEAVETGSITSTADSVAHSHVSSATILPPQPTSSSSVASTSPASRISRRFPSDLKTIKCTFAGCDKFFNRPARLAAHLRSHTNDRPHRCPYPGCGKDYLEEKHLTQHIKGSHTHERKYTCAEPDCGKSFVTATRLRRHAAVHEGAERFRCRGYDECALSFRKHQTLQRHIRTAHLGQSAFLCGNDGCQGGFDTAGALRRHVEREHGELKFWCDECAKENVGEEDDREEREARRVGFTTLILLQAHMKREHNNCIFCDAKCGTLGDMERHIDIHHSGTTVEDRKNVVCTWEGCDKRFTRQSNLNTHIKTAHEGLRFICGQVNTFETPDISDWNWMEEGCGHSFMSKLKLEEHVRFVHLGRRRPPKMYSVTSTLPDDVVDEITAGVVSSGRNIACTVPGCAAKFIRHHDFNRHIQNDHGDSYGYQEESKVAQEILTEADLGDPALVIDPQLQQLEDISMFGTPMEDDFWAPTGAPMPAVRQPSPAFEMEWREMRKLIDVDAMEKHTGV